jgi:peptidoglycan/LPS O-acetylase OafA/YrhL
MSTGARHSTWSPPSESGRQPGADLLRVATIAGLVVVHAAGTYAVDVGWYHQEPTDSFPLTVAVSVPADVGLFFGLGPLFLRAGEYAARSRQLHGSRPFLRRRLWRLGPPLLLYVAV